MFVFFMSYGVPHADMPQATTVPTELRKNMHVCMLLSLPRLDHSNPRPNPSPPPRPPHIPLPMRITLRMHYINSPAPGSQNVLGPRGPLSHE